MRLFESALVEDCHSVAAKVLRPTLMARERATSFSMDDWAEIQKTGPNQLLFEDAPEIARMQKLAASFYGLARGSMDLPFCASLAAHSVISLDLMMCFMNADQQKKYLPIMLKHDSIASICNSEEGAGSDLRKMKAVADIGANGEAVLNILKPCATNASGANLFLASTWARQPQKKDRLCMLVLEKDEVKTWSLQDQLAGFRTGITGGMEVRELEIDFASRSVPLQVHRNGQDLTLFKRCFDMERLFLGVMVAGILEGVEAEMKMHIEARESSGFSYSDKQYLQEKMIEVYSARAKITTIVECILNQKTFHLDAFSKELCLLKILVNEQASSSVFRFYELLGHRGYLSDQACQKVLRDFMGLVYFGGTTELQKNILYADIARTAESIPKAKSA